MDNILGPFLLLAAAGAYFVIHWDRVDDLCARGSLIRGTA